MDTKETQGAEPSAATDIAVVLDLTQTEKDLIAAEEKHKDVVYDVTAPKEMQAARAARKELKTMRTTVEKKRLEAGRLLLDMKATNDEKAKAMIARISVMEDPIDTAIKAEETRIEAVKAAAALAEQERQQGHRDAIQRMRDFPLSLQGKPSEVMKARQDKFIEAHAALYSETWDRFEEFAQEAADAYRGALYVSNETIQRQMEREEHDRIAAENAERVRKQDAELEELRREKAEREAAEAKRVRDEQEALKKKEHERVQRHHNALMFIKCQSFQIDRLDVPELQKRIEDIDALEPKSDEFEEFTQDARTEWDKSKHVLIAALEKRKEFEIEQKRQHEKQETERARLEAEAQRQREEQAKLDADRRAHAAQVERDRIAKLGLMEAVRAVVEYVEKGNSDVPRCILDLVEVYRTLPADKRSATKPVKRSTH